MVEQLVAAGAAILLVSFQGYEVTLPRSWPYVEAVFGSAQRRRIPRSFITNGMLLHKYAERARALDPRRVSVSLDGADAETNDPLRGIEGAFDATVRSIERFCHRAPELRDRLSVVSTLYSKENYRSLRSMPALLNRLGIRRWALGFELEVVGGVERPVRTRSELSRWLQSLQSLAEAADVRFHVNDEFGFFEGSRVEAPSPLRAKQLFDPSRVVRIDPLGTIRVGHEVVTEWNSSSFRRWRPGRDDLATLLGEALSSHAVIHKLSGETRLPCP